jgi:PST family polysaccharide transporter
MGGAAGATLVISMFRVKFAAVFIGASGVGLISAYSSVQVFISNLASLGLQTSGVRQIAADLAAGDNLAVSKTVTALRRLCFTMGLIGMILTGLFSRQISEIALGSQAHRVDVMLLGVVVFLANLTVPYLVVLQGLRQISTLARVNVFSAIIGSTASVFFYWTFQSKGVIMGILFATFAQLIIARLFSTGLVPAAGPAALPESLRIAGRLINLGWVVMWTGVLVALVSVSIVSMLTASASLASVGLYTAAFSLSGVFVNFILNSMAADYYPRLSGATSDSVRFNALISEQSEVSILLSLPGLLFTLSLSSEIVTVFYSRDFLAADSMLQLFILGCLGRVIAWPMGYAILAQGRSRWFLLTETAANVFHIFLVFLCFKLFGLIGVALAFVLLYALYTLLVKAVCYRLTRFAWKLDALMLVVGAVSALVIALAVSWGLEGWMGVVVNLCFSSLVSVWCFRRLVVRAGVVNWASSALAFIKRKPRS